MAENAGQGGGLTGCIGFVFDKLVIPATLAILGTMGGILQWTIEEQNRVIRIPYTKNGDEPYQLHQKGMNS